MPGKTNIQTVPVPLKYKTVVMIDWNNTIMVAADLENLVEMAHEETALRLKEANINLKMPIPQEITKKPKEMLTDLYGEENLKAAMHVYRAVYREIYDELNQPKANSIIPGAKEFIEKLTAAKIPIVIISNGSEAAIKENLEYQKIDYRNIPVIGFESVSHVKPHVLPGLIALEKLNIDPIEDNVKALMIGDGIQKDMAFAKNMNKMLRLLNPNSSCTGALFNSSLTGERIYKFQDIENFLGILNEVDPKHSHFNRAVVSGYGGLFKRVGNMLNPGKITPEMLAEQKIKLHSPK